MRVDRPRAEKQPGSSLLAAGPVGHDAGHLVLLRREPSTRRVAAARGLAAGPQLGDRGIMLITSQGLVRSPADNRALVEEGLRMAASGILRPVVGQVYPFSRAADAHAAIEARTTIGKTILVPS